VAADGDATIKTTVIDIVRHYELPGEEFRIRALRNRFVATWHGREGTLAEPATNAAENERYWRAFHSGDADNAGVMIGEATGLIRDILPAGRIVEDMVSQAERLLAEGPKWTAGLRT
jgi:nitronate monooxygenase